MNLSDIEKRCKAASPGPWKVINYWHVYTSPKEGIGRRIASTEHTGGCHKEEAANADLLAHAREDIPALLSMVQDLQSKLATAEGLVALQQEQMAGWQRKVGELEADAKRVDWLERLFDKQWNAVIDSGSRTYWSIWAGHRHRTRAMEGRTFREAIDAALNTETTG